MTSTDTTLLADTQQRLATLLELLGDEEIFYMDTKQAIREAREVLEAK